MFAIHLVTPALLAALAATPAPSQPRMELVVNIPAGRLDVLEFGQRTHSYPVSVGTPRHATPTGEAGIRRMVWNPSWTPPPDAAWARDEKPAAPGWSNPMGRVKMHLFDDYYVHGTPARNESRLGRPASHGCIRMRNADVMELARLVLRADGHAITDSTLARLERNPRSTRELALSGRVKVRIEYRLTDVESDSVALHPDVYAKAGRGYRTRVAEELRTAGHNPEALLASFTGTRAPATSLRIAREAPLPVREPVLTVGAPALARPAVETVALQR